MTAEYSNQEGYLLAKARVPWTVESAIVLIDETKNEATKRGYHHILFDLTEWKNPDSGMTRFYSGVHMAKVLGRPFKVAAFAIPEAINKFGEDAAVNRGAWFRIFPDELTAIQWLKEGE